jgi:hypothetical protein
MTRVYGYNVTGGSPLFATEADWEAQMTVDGAKRYLKDDLREQLTREIPPAVNAYLEEYRNTNVGVGFYAVARMIFPEITFLGCLYKGSDEAINAVGFLEKYAGSFDRRYQSLAAPVYVMYRHGLTHTAMPKIIERDDGQCIGWRLTLNESASHLSIEKEGAIWRIVVSLEQLFADTIKALDNYAADFDGENQAALLATFKPGYLTMAKIECIDDLKSKALIPRLRSSLLAL